MTTKTKQFSFLTILCVALACILIGGLIGAITNMINGSISPYYFKVLMFGEPTNIWTASVAQGIFEGLLNGIIFSIIFTTAYGFITKGKASYGFALKQLLKITVIVICCWILGGLLAMLLATLSPDLYKANFPHTPTDKTEMLKFAWVGGSIWGGVMGGLLSAVLGIVLLRNSWGKIDH